jgi:hypothetical protein
LPKENCEVWIRLAIPSALHAVARLIFHYFGEIFHFFYVMKYHWFAICTEKENSSIQGYLKMILLTACLHGMNEYASPLENFSLLLRTPLKKIHFQVDDALSRTKVDSIRSFGLLGVYPW